MAFFHDDGRGFKNSFPVRTVPPRRGVETRHGTVQG
jgi:hypothetical protein